MSQSALAGIACLILIVVGAFLMDFSIKREAKKDAREKKTDESK